MLYICDPAASFWQCLKSGCSWECQCYRTAMQACLLWIKVLKILKGWFNLVLNCLIHAVLYFLVLKSNHFSSLFIFRKFWPALKFFKFSPRAEKSSVTLSFGYMSGLRFKNEVSQWNVLIENTTCLLSFAHLLSKTSGGSQERWVNLFGGAGSEVERQAERGLEKEKRQLNKVLPQIIITLVLSKIILVWNNYDNL